MALKLKGRGLILTKDQHLARIQNLTDKVHKLVGERRKAADLAARAWKHRERAVGEYEATLGLEPPDHLCRNCLEVFTATEEEQAEFDAAVAQYGTRELVATCTACMKSLAAAGSTQFDGAAEDEVAKEGLKVLS